MKSKDEVCILYSCKGPLLDVDKKVEGVFETKRLARKYVEKKEIKYYYIEKVDYYEEK